MNIKDRQRMDANDCINWMLNLRRRIISQWDLEMWKGMAAAGSINLFFLQLLKGKRMTDKGNKILDTTKVMEEQVQKVVNDMYIHDFRGKLEDLINRESMENGSDTPDFILAEYLKDCLVAFDKATTRRTDWYKPEEKTDDNAKGT